MTEEVDEIRKVARSIGVSRAVRAGRGILEPLETRMVLLARRLADEEAQDLSVHVEAVLDQVGQTTGEVAARVNARYQDMAEARADARLACGASVALVVARHADMASVLRTLGRLRARRIVARSGWLTHRWTLTDRRTGEPDQRPAYFRA